MRKTKSQTCRSCSSMNRLLLLREKDEVTNQREKQLLRVKRPRKSRKQRLIASSILLTYLAAGAMATFNVEADLSSSSNLSGTSVKSTENLISYSDSAASNQNPASSASLSSSVSSAAASSASVTSSMASSAPANLSSASSLSSASIQVNKAASVSQTSQTQSASALSSSIAAVVVSDYAGLSSAIAAAPTDGTEYDITISGVIQTQGGQISVASGTNIVLSGGELQSGTGSGQGAVQFVLNGNADFTVHDVLIDDSAAAPQGIFIGADTSAAATLNLTGTTKLVGLYTEGGQYDARYAIDTNGIKTVNMSDDADITNWYYAYMPGGLADSTLNMSGNAKFENNYVGLYREPASPTSPPVVVNMTGNASFSNNVFGIVTTNQLLLTGGIFKGNTSVGVYVSQDQSSDTRTSNISNATFDSNNTSYAPLYIRLGNNVEFDLSNSSFSNNTSQHAAGAEMGASGLLKVINSTFTNNNSSANAGAIGLNSSSSLSLAGSTLTGNTAALNGGAVGFYDNQGNPYSNTADTNANGNLTNITADAATTFSGNTASLLTLISSSDQALHDEKILAKQFSALGNAYNNYDIQYYGDSVQAATVKFNSNGGTTVPDENTQTGVLVIKPTDPTREGYTFAGWYKDADLTQAWNFDSDTIPNNLTAGVLWLYAKWIPKDTPTPPAPPTPNPPAPAPKPNPTPAADKGNGKTDQELPAAGDESNLLMYLGFISLILAGGLAYRFDKKSHRED